MKKSVIIVGMLRLFLFGFETSRHNIRYHPAESCGFPKCCHIHNGMRGKGVREIFGEEYGLEGFGLREFWYFDKENLCVHIENGIVVGCERIR